MVQSDTVSKVTELIPLIAAGGIMWSDPNIIAALILVFGSIIVALINKLVKPRK